MIYDTDVCGDIYCTNERLKKSWKQKSRKDIHFVANAYANESVAYMDVTLYAYARVSRCMWCVLFENE